MHDHPPLIEPGPRYRVLTRIGALTVADLHALDEAVEALLAERSHRHIDKGFYFAWWDGPNLPRELEDEVQALFADVLVALARGLTGIDVEQVAPQLNRKRGGFGLDGLLDVFMRPQPSRRSQDAAIALLEGHVAPWDPRRAVVATWNMVCAVALRGHLREPARATLEAAWRRALGDLPA
jgi:hypothetical protein